MSYDAGTPNKSLNDRLISLDLQTLSGPNGAPLRVEQVQVVTEVNAKNGEEVDWVTLSGVATDALNDPKNPTAGSKPLADFPEGYTWEQRLKVGGDLQTTFMFLNAAFKFKERLEDTEEEIGRFFAADPRSVVPEIEKAEIYVQTKVRPSAIPEKYAHTVYANITPMASRVSTSDPKAYQQWQAKQKARQESLSFA